MDLFEPGLAEQQTLGVPEIIDTLHGKFMICNPQETIQSALLKQGEFELQSSVLAQEILKLKPGDIVDVGANIGIFSVPVGIAFPDRCIHSFEPQRNVFSHLSANLLINRLLNVRAYPLAVGVASPNQEIQVPEFNIFEERYTGSVTLDASVVALRSEIPGVAEPAQWARHFTSVRIVQLDDYLSGQSIAFIKVDVEGMELSVFKSAAGILQRDKPALYFEAWNLEQFAASNASLMQFIQSHGYHIWTIGNDCLAIHLDDAPVMALINAAMTSSAVSIS